MHRRPLRALLDRYLVRHPDEAATARRFAAFVDEHEDCLLRTCRPGHVTAAAWILSPDRGACLLVHHRKLDRWLQPGGHVDGDPDVLRAALREAREESGLERFAVPSAEPFDLDIHEIPARGDEPAHLHLDVRFLLVAEAGQTVACSGESHAVRWFPVERLHTSIDDDSVLRMARKAKALSTAGRAADNPG